MALVWPPKAPVGSPVSTQAHWFPAPLFQLFLEPSEVSKHRGRAAVGRHSQAELPFICSNSGCYHLRKLVPVLGKLKGGSDLLY